MNLWDIIDHATADALDRIGIAGTAYPRGVATGFAVSVGFGDLQPATEAAPIGEVDQVTVQATVRRSTWRAGMLAHTSPAAERDALRGDEIIIPSGANVGTWRVEESAPDDGGGLLLTLRRESLNAIAGAAAREIR